MGDAGRILSREEVETLLAAVGSPPPPPALDPFQPPCLRSGELAAADVLRRELGSELSVALGAALRAPVTVRPLDDPGANWPETGWAAGEDHAVALDPEFAFPALERLLGGPPGEALLPGRPPSDTEWRLLRVVLEALATALGRTLPGAGTFAPAVPSRQPAPPGPAWNYEVAIGGRKGGLRIFVAERRLAAELARRGARPAAPEAPVVLRLPRLYIRLSDAGSLRVGDVLSSSLSADSGWILDGGAGRVLGARAGELDGRVAAELSGPAAREVAGTLERIAGPSPSDPAGAVVVELAAVAGALRVPPDLRPGMDLPLGAPGPLALAAGDRPVAEGALDRRGDRLVFRVERLLPRP